MITLALLAPLALLAACGGGGGGNGGSGGSGGSSGDGGGATTTSSGTGTGGSSTQDPGCVELCTELVKCPDIPSSNCADDCPPVEMLNESGMCTDAYSAMVACILASPDPCQAYDEDCINEAAEYVTCQNAYCKAHPGTPGCP